LTDDRRCSSGISSEFSSPWDFGGFDAIQWAFSIFIWCKQAHKFYISQYPQVQVKYAWTLLQVAPGSYVPFTRTSWMGQLWLLWRLLTHSQSTLAALWVSEPCTVKGTLTMR
jgi:hypothetical protein